jgi:hypothetical protein
MSLDDGLRPGLAKTRGDRLVRLRVVTLVRGSDGPLREMFAGADAVSEGSVQASGGVPVWYGSTSLILPWPPNTLSGVARGFLAAVVERDPHARLRAVRIAHREASLRAPAPLGRAECELKVGARDEGLRIDVDVQAPLTLPSHLGASGSRPEF